MYKKILLNILLILLFVALVGTLTNFLWQFKSVEKNNPPSLNTNQENINNGNDKTEELLRPTIIEPENIDRYEGTILTIEENLLTLSTVFGEKIVEFNNDTAWKKIFLQKFPPIPGRADTVKQVPNPETISVAEVSSGQRVEVVSDHNISGQQKFFAKEINLIVKYN